jgi:uncharacterized membrane-anchored protein
MRSAIAAGTCALALILVNVAIADKERLLAHGKIVYLELAPVDPRSLMQGDYMALRFRIANDAGKNGLVIDGRPGSADGRIVAAIDERSIASFRRLDNGQPLAPDEIALRYRVRGGQVKFATNAFFFQEGTGGLYETAGYGEFRVADNGDMLLTGLRDGDLRQLGPQ